MSKKNIQALLLSFLLCTAFADALAQKTVYISGTVVDTAGNVIPEANIYIENTNKGTSLTNGHYIFSLDSGKSYIMTISHIGYKTQQHTLDLRQSAPDTLKIHSILHHNIQHLPEVSIISRQQGTYQRLETRYFKQLPNPSGSMEALLKTYPGVSSNNELSSQYSVRGGSFDENLIYIDDIEIHRPVLIRSGQQEGLSFINPDMISSVDFSAGGFDARYGDKMSSVLDVKYRNPTTFAGNASLSLLGASASVEGISGNQKFSFITGIRYKTSRYLLGTLDTNGDYNPDFMDIQGKFTYRINPQWNISALGNISQNKYRFIPESRTTSFGTLYNPYQLVVYYDGKEVDQYNSGLGALTLHYQNNRLFLKLIGSAYRSHEKETFDIEGSYRLSEVIDTSDSTTTVGIGSELNHARNYLDAGIYTLSHVGGFYGKNSSLRWSVAYSLEKTDNKLNEWSMVDSAGYSVPYNERLIEMSKHIWADNHLDIQRITSSLQYTQNLTGNHFEWSFTAGLRVNYNNLNHEWLVSPRGTITIRPHTLKALSVHIAAGLYGQPPSYRELRDEQGAMNKDMKAQRSVHYVIGGDYTFFVGNRPFRISSEIYYKQLNRLNPYRLENVRIFYAADNIATGYITGWDIKLNGEFIEDTESWISFSLMHARGDIKDDGYGSFPLPTDHWANFNLFFQDYIPGLPTWRAYVNLVFGSRLPYNYPLPDRYDLTFRMPAYRRVDIGLSKEFFKTERSHRFIKQIWLNAEIFNLFGTYNTISYLWVEATSDKSGQKRKYAVPNYLTGRRINVKLNMSF